MCFDIVKKQLIYDRKEGGEKKEMHSIIEYFYTESDTAEDRRIKKITMYSMMFSVCGSLSAVGPQPRGVICGFAAGLGALFMLKWFATKKQTRSEVVFGLYMWLFVIIALDFLARSEVEEPLWPCVVLVVDITLLCNLSEKCGTGIVVTLVVYLLIIMTESVGRYGLFDIIYGDKAIDLECLGLTPDEVQTLPCKKKLKSTLIYTMVFIGVFVMDYYCTRNFANKMRAGQQKLESSISLAETVVAALVRLDLDEAENHIVDSNPTDLTAILKLLIRNLNEYRPYLPDSLFDLRRGTQFHDLVKPPQSPATVLFTDLKSSTAIWEASPDAMTKALKIHNKIIRSCMAEHGGYEVKTIGDSFMVAFETLADGVTFAIAVQEQFTITVWPSDLIVPQSFENSSLMLRIGLHHGDVDLQICPLNGRTDYVGRTSNKAARMEGVCVPGGIALDSTFIDEIVLAEGWSFTFKSEDLKGFGDHQCTIAILSRKQFNLDSLEVSSGCSSFISVAPSVPSVSINHDHRISQELELAKKNSTVCAVHMVINSDDHLLQYFINTALGKTITCMERTEGSIVSVMSSSITIGWNTTRVSRGHFQDGLRFVSLMYGLFYRDDARIGISSGPVHCGRVGTRDQRFVTVFGTCLRTCHLLCLAAQDVGTFAVCANAPFDFPTRRPIDRWCSDESFLVYELQARELKRWLSVTMHQEVSENTDPVDWGWSPDYVKSFNEGNWKEIKKRRTQSDKVLARVAAMLQNGISLRVSV